MASNSHRKPASSFTEEASGPQPGFVGDFVDFLRCNKKWWLTPIIVVLLLASLMMILGGSAAAPFIYTLF